MITLDRERCNDCRECMWVCPNDVFGVGPNGGGPGQLEVLYPDQCCACGHCIAVCERNGLSHPDLPRDQFAPLPAPQVPAADLLALMLARRSIRRFHPDPPPPDLIDTLLAAATHAGTSSNGQTEGFVLIKDRTFMRELERVVVDVLWNAGFKHLGRDGLAARIATARLGREMVRQYRAYHGVIRHRLDRDELAGTVFRDAPLVVAMHGLRTSALAPINCALALRNIELLAIPLGLGSCWAGFLVGAAARSRRIAQMLGLGADRQLCGALMVGRPAEHYTVTMPRKPRQVRWAGFTEDGA